MGTLIALFGLVAVMYLCGLVMERHNQLTDDVDWSAYVVGTIAGVVPWIVIGVALFGTFTLGSGSPPNFVILIYVSIALLFNRFAITMILQYLEIWKFEDYPMANAPPSC